MRGAAVRPPRRHCWAVVFLAALRAAHLQPRRRCWSSVHQCPLCTRSFAITGGASAFANPGGRLSHIITFDRSTRLLVRIHRLSRMPDAKRMVDEYVVDGPTLKNKKGSVCRRWPRRWIKLPRASLHNRARGTRTTRTQPVGAGCLSTPGARLLLAYCSAPQPWT